MRQTLAKRTVLGCSIVLAAVIVTYLIPSSAAQPVSGAVRCYAAADPNQAQNTISLWNGRKKPGKDGEDKRFDVVPSNVPQGAFQSLKGTTAHGKATGVQWNLPPGVIVIFYEHDNGGGRQFVVWGQGQVEHLDAHAFNDVATSWAWFRV